MLENLTLKDFVYKMALLEYAKESIYIMVKRLMTIMIIESSTEKPVANSIIARDNKSAT